MSGTCADFRGGILLASLNKVRKNYAALSESQKAIDNERAKLDELKQLKKDPEVQELSDKYEAVKKELDGIKAEQDAALVDDNRFGTSMDHC